MAILQNSEEYQSIAIEAARHELKTRQLTEDELNRLLFELETRKKQKNINQSNSTASRIKINVKRFLTAINPFDFSYPEAERIIRATVFWNSIIYLILIYTSYEKAGWLIFDLAVSPFSTLIGLIPFLFYPICIIGFALRKRFGWLLLSFFLAISTISLFWLFCRLLLRLITTSTVLDLYINRGTSTEYIIPLIISGVTLFAISKSDVRSIYRISKDTMIKLFAISLIAGVLIEFMY